MAYYNVCEICGATLDPGEKRTCVEDVKAEAEHKEIKRRADVFMQLISINNNKRKSKRGK